ncbi:HAD family hydrolase [Streptomyces acidicola]|uniref:HAD family hydrolase n=1 Tax=Streptomyces acidicola TaxID=2596892 RepID=UPI00343F58D3
MRPLCFELFQSGFLLVDWLVADRTQQVYGFLADPGLKFRGQVEQCEALGDPALGAVASGYTARHEVAAALTNRYGDNKVPTTAIRALLDMGAADRIVLAHPAREALGQAQADGCTCVIVSNGRTTQQEAKIRNTGLDQLVQGWVISEDVGHKKPEPEIFQAAADAVSLPLPGAWVIGDSPHADIAGANTVGLRSVWVTDGRAWTQDSYQPTHVAADVAAAIKHAIRTSG